MLEKTKTSEFQEMVERMLDRPIQDVRDFLWPEEPHLFVPEVWKLAIMDYREEYEAFICGERKVRPKFCVETYIKKTAKMQALEETNDEFESDAKPAQINTPLLSMDDFKAFFAIFHQSFGCLLEQLNTVGFRSTEHIRLFKKCLHNYIFALLKMQQIIEVKISGKKPLQFEISLIGITSQPKQLNKIPGVSAKIVYPLNEAEQSNRDSMKHVFGELVKCLNKKIFLTQRDVQVLRVHIIDNLTQANFLNLDLDRALSSNDVKVSYN